MKTAIPAAGAFLVGITIASGACGPRLYTLDDDFDEGVLFNVNHDSPDNDQLQLDTGGSVETLPFMYIANAGEDTVSKIDTVTGREVARYRTWFGPSGQPGWAGTHSAWSGPAPSRSAVDSEGNAYVANREFRGGVPTLVKIYNTKFKDRNGNGVVDTSTDANNNGVIDPSDPLEMKHWGDTIPPAGDGIIQDSEILDERIAWIVRVGPANGIARSVSIAPSGNIWVGYYNSRVYTEHDPETGAQVSGPHSTGPQNPYGSLVDSNDILWGAGWTSRYLLRMDTTSGAYTLEPGRPQIYGIAITSGSPTQVYMAYATAPYYQYTDGVGYSDPSGEPFSCYGISTDGDGNILTSGWRSGSYRGCSKFSPTGTTVWTSPPQVGAPGGNQRGAIVDSNGDVWTVNLNSNNVSKFSGVDGSALGVHPVGLSPYTYSDASGSSFIQTNPTGTWEVVHDAGETGAKNIVVSWNGQTPGGSTLEVFADASDTKTTVGDFDPNLAVSVTNGAAIPVIAGRHIYVRVKFSAANLTSPILEDLMIRPCPQLGDLNDDCCIDRADLNILMGEIRNRVVFDPQDAWHKRLDVNADGEINLSDARQIVLWFCFPLGDPCPGTPGPN